MTSLLRPTLDTDAEFARITAALTRRGFLGAGALAGIGLLTSCRTSSGEPAAGEMRTITTVNGQVEVPVNPKRVVSADYYTGPAMVDAGFTPVGLPVDYENTDGIPEPYASALQSLPKVGRWYEPNAEAIAALSPDLIVMTDRLAETSPDLYEQIRSIAPTAVFAEEGQYAWKDRARGVADALNQSAKVEELADRYEARIAKFRSDNADVLSKVKVVYTTYFEESGFSLYSPTKYQTTVISEAGFQFNDRSLALPAGTNEWFLKEQLELLDEADVIITNSGKGPINEKLAGDTIFERLRAVKNGQVYSFDYEGVASFGWALTFLEQFQPIVGQIRAKL
jgi:iron complex transport system substrate-binding protein